MKKLRVFISSVQKELAAERLALAQYIRADALLSRFFEAFLFEDLSAADARADAVYLSEVDRCDVYLALLGQSYGFEDAQGISPTEREFDRATAIGKTRLIYVLGQDRQRHPKMQVLVQKAGDQLIRRRAGSMLSLIHISEPTRLM
jgi:ATP-dependent DNA helicase RecG